MKNIFDKGKEAIYAISEKVGSEITSGFSQVQKIVNGLPIFISLEKNQHFDTDYDEKHYFIVPFKCSTTGFSLHTMRCLPEGVLEINELPKRRVFHFPNEHYEASLKAHMLQMAKAMAQDNQSEHYSTLEQLANDIDALDRKLTYGMLLVGGIAAVFNPLVGAGIAAKALLPGVAGLLSKYGFRPVGEKLTQYQVEKAIKNAEQDISVQFSQANTLKVVNPILQELELTLRTTEAEHDPLTGPNLSQSHIPELDTERWRELTEIAVYHIYKEIYNDPTKHQEAGLGPEDLRWLKTLFSAHSD